MAYHLDTSPAVDLALLREERLRAVQEVIALKQALRDCRDEIMSLAVASGYRPWSTRRADELLGND